MNKYIDARTLKEELDRVFEEAVRDNTHTIVDRDGKDVVVILGLADTLKLEPAPGGLEAFWAESRARGLDTITMEEIDAEIAAYRKEATGAHKRP